MLRRAGLGLFVGALLFAPSVATAGPALVFEPVNGTVFYSEDPDAQWFPASLTKLMTAYVTFQALKRGEVQPDTKLTCTKNAVDQAPSKLWLPVGGQITVDIALKVLIVKSANDVAVMLAEGVAGSEEAFVARMNEAAQKLGMTRTHYANPNGLPDDRQVTSARDLAKLTRAIIVEFPEYADIFALPSVTVGKKVLRTHNRLLASFPGADGMKTGFICDFGLQRRGERHARRQAARCRGARRAVRGHPHRPRRQSAGERLQALLLEVGVRHHHRRSCHAGLAERRAARICATSFAAPAAPNRRASAPRSASRPSRSPRAPPTKARLHLPLIATTTPFAGAPHAG